MQESVLETGRGGHFASRVFESLREFGVMTSRLRRFGESPHGSIFSPCLLVLRFLVSTWSLPAQLEEEAHLEGGTWYPLCDHAATSINADKYNTNEFFCWLVVDPDITTTPRPMDDEEFIEIERGISMQTVMGMLGRGEITVLSGFVILMAARKLRQLGLVSGEDC